MKTIYYLNTSIYLIVIALYCFQPILGALSQMVLGIFQIIIAIRLSLESEYFHQTPRKALKVYWQVVLIWFILFIVGIVVSYNSSTDLPNSIIITLVFIVPMLIGFYFTRVTFLVYKHAKQ